MAMNRRDLLKGFVAIALPGSLVVGLTSNSKPSTSGPSERSFLKSVGKGLKKRVEDNYNNYLDNEKQLDRTSKTESLENKAERSVEPRNPVEPKYTGAKPSEVYLIAPGDTLGEIAERVDVDMKDLMRYNNIKNPGEINFWEFLYLKPNVKLKNSEEVLLTTQALYGEAANQPRDARRMIAQVPRNRARQSKKGYKKTALGNLRQKSIFSQWDKKKRKGNEAWKQIHRNASLNEYQNIVLQRCFHDALFAINGGRLGIPNGDEDLIVAYHDNRTDYKKLTTSKKRGEKDKAYWRSLVQISPKSLKGIDTGKLTFYKHKAGFRDK